MAFESNLAGVARIAFEAQTGEAQRDVLALEHTYRSATSKMSDSALRLELAENRLQRQIARGPANYQALARAELQVRRAEAELAAETGKTTTRLNARSAAQRGFSHALAFTSTAILGGTGLVYALRTATKAAEDHQVLEGQLKIALNDAGITYKYYAGQIQTADKAAEHLGFTEEDRYRSLIVLVRATKDVTQAERLRSTATDISRARNVPLIQATNALAKATSGQDTALRRLIPGLDKQAKGYDLIADAQRRTAGAAENYSKTSAGAQDRLNAAIHTTEVTIGTALLPTVERLSNKFADWAGNEENQKRVQRDVNTAVHDGTIVLKGLTKGVHLLGAAISPVVDALGGLENAAELALIVGVLAKLRKVAGGFGLIQVASRLTRGRIVADSAAEVVALEAVAAAEGQVAAGGGTILGPNGKPIPRSPKKGGKFSLPGVIPRLAGTPGAGTAATLVLLAAGGDSSNQGAINKYPRALRLFLRAVRLGTKNLSPAEQNALKLFGQYTVSDAPESVLKRVDDALRGVPGYGGGTAAASPTSTASSAGAIEHGRSGALPAAPAPTATVPTSLADAALRAALTPDQGDDLRAAQAEEKFLRANLARAKKGTKLYSDILAALVSAHQQVEAAQAAIDAENQRHATARSEAARKRAAASAKRERDYRDQLATHEQRLRNTVDRAGTPAQREHREDALLDFLKRETHDARLTAKERERYRTLLQRERDLATKAIQADKQTALANAVTRAEIAVEKATKGTAAYEKAIAAEKRALQAEVRYYASLAKNAKTSVEKQRDLAKELAAQKKIAVLGKTKGAGAQADFAKLSFDFLQSLHGTINDLGGNLAPLGALHVQGQVQTALLRDIHGALTDLGRGVRNPHARYAQTELNAKFDGVSGF